MVRHKFEKSEDKFKEMLDNCHYSLRNDEGLNKVSGNRRWYRFHRLHGFWKNQDARWLTFRTQQKNQWVYSESWSLPHRNNEQKSKELDSSYCSSMCYLLSKFIFAVFQYLWGGLEIPIPGSKYSIQVFKKKKKNTQTRSWNVTLVSVIF